jgi:pimeloyl-ACP methyl ester carboxylesterase
MQDKQKKILLEFYKTQKISLQKDLFRNEIYAVLILFGSIVFSYGFRDSTNLVFVNALTLFAMQFFSTRTYRDLICTSKIIKQINSDIFPPERFKVSWTSAAGIAVKDTYFVCFLFFDFCWMFYSYAMPDFAGTMDLYIQRLAIGPLSGKSFIIFTSFFWIFYTIFFFIGLYFKKELTDDEYSSGIKRAEFVLKVKTYSGEIINLKGYRIPNIEKQPLILIPGFFQNGYVYDLSQDCSLATHLWKEGFDIWIIHPRGTNSSDRSKISNCLDDFASDDFPELINFVTKNTKLKPILIGHSQGGISSIISLIGISKDSNGIVQLSKEKSFERQSSLKGLVTLGSFPDFKFSKESSLQNFVKNGISILFIKIKSESILKAIKFFKYIPVPLSHGFRGAISEQKALYIISFPIKIILNIISLLKTWEFLYHIPSVSKKSRINLFYKTIDGTFWQILNQFFYAISEGEMRSFDRKINYSENYHLINVPVSIVTMELDSLADPMMTRDFMLDKIASAEKHFTVWKYQGHEDFFMNAEYFKQVSEAIKLIYKV